MPNTPTHFFCAQSWALACGVVASDRADRSNRSDQSDRTRRPRYGVAEKRVTVLGAHLVVLAPIAGALLWAWSALERRFLRADAAGDNRSGPLNAER